ncbi:MAG: heme exporter protein CcmB [Rubrivivax sp.]|nr:heme exporter protein CcmB [Rubrivivax sp.]
MHALFLAVLLRELHLVQRRPVDALLPVAFFIVCASLFPLGVGPEPQTLRAMAPGIAWVGALLATMMSVQHLYAADLADGSLDQLLLAPQSALVVALAKGAAHWLTHGLPLIVTAPLVGLMFGLSWAALGALMISLTLGTPILSLLGGLGAALTLGLRGGGMLLILIVLPLTVPALIFGAGAVAAVEAGVGPSGHFSLLGALLIGTLLGAPWATAAALRISTD